MKKALLLIFPIHVCSGLRHEGFFSQADLWVFVSSHTSWHKGCVYVYTYVYIYIYIHNKYKQTDRQTGRYVDSRQTGRPV